MLRLGSFDEGINSPRFALGILYAEAWLESTLIVEVSTGVLLQEDIGQTTSSSGIGLHDDIVEAIVQS